MKICLITEAKTVHAKRWAKGLSKAGCDVHLISVYQANLRGVKLYHVPIYSSNPVRQVINNVRLNRLIKIIDPEVIHLFGLFSVFSLGSMGVIHGKKNLVISVWGSDVVSAGNKDSLKINLIKKFILNCGDRLIATSDYLAAETKKYLNPNKDVDVLPWGVDLDVFYPHAKKSNNGTVRIGFAKRLNRLYGPDTLLQAFQYALRNSQKKLLLKIAGEGPLESELKHQAAEMGINNSIEWIGWLDRDEDMKEFYNSIDIFIMPSRRESFGVAAVEASASGLPVIASRFGGIPEVIIENETGLLVDSEDSIGFGRALLKLTNDDKLRQKMGVKGRKRAEIEFNWNITIQKMLEIYQQVQKMRKS